MMQEVKVERFAGDGRTVETATFDDDIIEARRRLRRTIAIIAAIVLALAAAATWFWMNKKGDAAAAQSSAAVKTDTAKDIPVVTVATPARQTVARDLVASGTLAAKREVPIGVVGEGGRVTEVRTDAGQWVSKGQVLVVIDRSVQAQQVNQSRAQITSAESDARLAEAEYQRAAALVSRGFISKATVDQKRAARDAANARVQVARAGLGELQARNARLDIRAPSSGYILSRAVEVGQVVGAGAAPLFTMAREGEIELKAQLNEADLAGLNVGAQANVTPVGYDRSFTGHVWQILPTIDPQTRMGIARVAVPFDHALKPGGFASATIRAGSLEAPLLPDSAVMTDQQGKNYVYIVNANNKVERRDVKTGTVTNQGIAIADGLSGTEQVILRAGGFVNEGETVKTKRAAQIPSSGN